MKAPKRKIPRRNRIGSLLKKIRRLRFRGVQEPPGAQPASRMGPPQYCYYEIGGQWCRCELRDGHYGNCKPYAGTPPGPYCGDPV